MTTSITNMHKQGGTMFYKFVNSVNTKIDKDII